MKETCIRTNVNNMKCPNTCFRWREFVFFFMFMYGITKVCDKIKYLFLFEKIKPRESNNKYAKVDYVKDQIRIETCLYGSK